MPRSVASMHRVRCHSSQQPSTQYPFSRIYLVKRIGSIGVVAGTAISYILVLIIPQTIIVWNALYPRTPLQVGNSAPLQGTEDKPILSRRLFETLLLHSFRLGTWLSRTIGILPRPVDSPHQRQRLLVVHLTPHLGDSVMLMPMLERLHEAQPEMELELAIGAEVAAMFEVLPWLNRVYPVNVPLETRPRRGFSVLRIWQLARGISPDDAKRNSRYLPSAPLGRRFVSFSKSGLPHRIEAPHRLGRNWVQVPRRPADRNTLRWIRYA